MDEWLTPIQVDMGENANISQANRNGEPK
jgi:hypothetical protein